MKRIEKQFALMELQFLLGDHRASDRRQADALVRRLFDLLLTDASEDNTILISIQRSVAHVHSLVGRLDCSGSIC